MTFATFGRIAGSTAGLFAAALVAGSSPLVDYSVNARGYTIAVLLGMVTVALAWELRRTTADARRLVLVIGMVAAIGLWTVPVFVFVWGGALCWVLAPGSELQTRERLLAGVSAGGLSILGAAVLYLPVTVNEGPEALVANRFVQSAGTRELVGDLPEFLRDVGSTWTANLPLVVLLVLLAGLGLALASRRFTELRWLLVTMATSAAVLLGMQRAIPYARSWLVFLPIALGVAGSPLARWFPRPGRSKYGIVTVIGVSVAAIWLAANVWTSSGSLSGQDDGLLHAEQIAQDLHARLRANDRVATAPPSTAPLRYYLWLKGAPDRTVDPPPPSEGELFVVTAGQQTVEQVLERHGLDPDGRATLVSNYPTGRLWHVARTDEDQ